MLLVQMLPSMELVTRVQQWSHLQFCCCFQGDVAGQQRLLCCGLLCDATNWGVSGALQQLSSTQGGGGEVA